MASRIVHHSLRNTSGLHRVAMNMVMFERLAGLDSVLSYTNEPTFEMKDPGGKIDVVSQANAVNADVHVIHSHIEDEMKGKTVFIAHGTPEHCFNTAIEQSKASGYAAGDPWMLSLHRINTADMTVTFWPRHAYIWKSMNRKSDVRTVPLGVDTEFWSPQPTQGKWAGSPSLFTCENSHAIKWPLDLILAFPLVMKETKSVLHIHYMPMDQHRWWYPMMQANGTSYRSYSSGSFFDTTQLRNSFCSVDYYLSPVRYGDFNTVCLEAKAAGCKVISYAGNEYADYWLQEGDQRVMAQSLLDIISGKTPARTTTPVPSCKDTTDAMIKIYKELFP